MHGEQHYELMTNAKTGVVSLTPTSSFRFAQALRSVALHFGSCKKLGRVYNVMICFIGYHSNDCGVTKTHPLSGTSDSISLACHVLRVQLPCGWGDNIPIRVSGFALFSHVQFSVATRISILIDNKVFIGPISMPPWKHDHVQQRRYKALFILQVEPA